jgi:hypothetical protein
MLALNACRSLPSGLQRPALRPRPRDRYFLVIEAKDPKFDLEATRRFLADLNPSEVSEVEP